MRVAIYSYYPNDATRAVIEKLTVALNAAHLTIDDDNPDVVVSVGGDGTLLSAFHHYRSILDHIRFVGLHTGHLGFYTDWRDYEIDQLVTSLAHDNGESVSYPLLDINITYKGETAPQQFLALNEATVKKAAKTLVCDVYIKDQLFERFRGDGLCFSTPTGSTGYNKSLGGAVLHPGIEAIQMAEIASINNRVFRTLGASFIIGKDEWVTLRSDDADNFSISCDQFLTPERLVKEITFKVSNQRISFAEYRHTAFWQRVRESFIGDVL
ncbi:NAD kinase [Furfurilactobacillus siliginis]|uniref:NAD kinase n=1 Tax=Furfurilactobacillus siliginis TaxID=348151 RepID=A0A0R2LCK0_9LACO|nr:NAD kinase [Furfurilactobacillus siliginis]KRN96100.1 inorganic polyphosphate ATP-NAD kinase [Furfurilactobacillus siliginis]GEK27976.1 NAD kinase [Furfurilactobacillus siliginis]